DRTCAWCELPVRGRVAEEVERVRTAQREVRGLAARGDLDAETAARVVERLEARVRAARGAPERRPAAAPAAPAVPTTPAPAAPGAHRPPAPGGADPPPPPGGPPPHPPPPPPPPAGGGPPPRGGRPPPPRTDPPPRRASPVGAAEADARVGARGVHGGAEHP